MDDARDRLSPFLLPGETLVWTGRPDPAKHLGPADAFLVPFSVFWLGFSIFWLVGAASSDAPLPFVLFGVPFVALGVYFVAGRFLVKAAGKRRTVYGLTEGRALVAEGEGSLQETSLVRTPVDRRRSRGGRHVTVSFGRTSRGWASGPSLRQLRHGPLRPGAAPPSPSTTWPTWRASRLRCGGCARAPPAEDGEGRRRDDGAQVEAVPPGRRELRARLPGTRPARCALQPP